MLWQMDDGPKETATSSEFDAFLATREKEASSATSSSGTTSNRGGRTLQNAEEDQALFSLWKMQTLVDSGRNCYFCMLILL